MLTTSDQSDLDSTLDSTQFALTDNQTSTSFDAYFLHTSKPSRTSSNVFSQLVQPLSPDEFTTSLSRSFYPLPFPSSTSSAPEQQQQQADDSHHLVLVPRYLLELAAGFNLLFYGLGSKRRALNDLARACVARAHAHVIVINGFQPGLTVRDIIVALARLPGAPQGVEDVSQFLSSDPTTTTTASTASKTTRRRRRRLVLVVHNMDAPALRAPGKARALLDALASLDGLQLVASVDHINAPLLWTSTEMLKWRWLWHDLTTLESYDVELAGTDPASLRAASRVTAAATTTTTMTGAATAAVEGGGRMTETAARHVLAAVTQRARKLFVLIGRRQLDALVDAGTVDPTTTMAPEAASEVAIAYDMLFNLARDHFVATNDTALRTLLGEFRDHGLVVTVGTGAMGTGEMLWIPLRKERLAKLLDGLQQEEDHSVG
jgi:origin recognition complex subunit 2